MNKIFLSLAFMMGLVVLASNYLVQFPIKYYGLEDILTYGAFSYPIAFLITDLANRSFGKIVARKIVYIGFIIINIELLEIVLDGLFGTHRILAPYLGSFYSFLIASFEVLAALVIISVILFWTRRNLLKINRFWNPEMKGWPKKDADFILYFEIILMSLFLLMNATDFLLQNSEVPNYVKAGFFPVSQFITPFFTSFSIQTLILFERTFWWLHI